MTADWPQTGSWQNIFLGVSTRVFLEDESSRPPSPMLMGLMQSPVHRGPEWNRKVKEGQMPFLLEVGHQCPGSRALGLGLPLAPLGPSSPMQIVGLLSHCTIHLSLYVSITSPQRTHILSVRSSGGP